VSYYDIKVGMWLKRKTEVECQEWLEREGIPDLATGSESQAWLKYAFRIPEAASRRSWVATRIGEHFKEIKDLLIWYRDWPFAGPEELSLVEAIGTNEFQPTPLVKAPGFQVSSPKISVGLGMFELGCLLGIDTLIAGSKCPCAAFTSHDGVIVFAATDRNRLAQLSHELLEGGVSPIS
jgi:hypothetical protein